MNPLIEQRDFLFIRVYIMGLLLRWTLRLLDHLTADELRNAVVFLRQFSDQG